MGDPCCSVLAVARQTRLAGTSDADMHTNQRRIDTTGSLAMNDLQSRSLPAFAADSAR
jgi:hypothetical protein